LQIAENDRTGGLRMSCECYIGGPYIPGQCPSCLAEDSLYDQLSELEIDLSEARAELDLAAEIIQALVTECQAQVSANSVGWLTTIDITRAERFAARYRP
jgi:hypothetical protein